MNTERAATRTVVNGAEALPTLRQRLDPQGPYRMIPEGRRDKDGHRRFTYPPIEKMLARPISTPTIISITVPPVLPVNEAVAAGAPSGHKPRLRSSENLHPKPQAIKFVQHLPHKGPEWRAYYGMRSLVEGSNNLLKSPAHGNIENTKKRSGRGYAATFLALTFAVVTSNLKRIASFFVAEANRIEQSRITTRTRRRSDERGAPLHRAEPAPPRSLSHSDPIPTLLPQNQNNSTCPRADHEHATVVDVLPADRDLDAHGPSDGYCRHS